MKKTKERAEVYKFRQLQLWAPWGLKNRAWSKTAYRLWPSWIFRSGKTVYSGLKQGAISSVELFTVVFPSATRKSSFFPFTIYSNL